MTMSNKAFCNNCSAPCKNKYCSGDCYQVVQMALNIERRISEPWPIDYCAQCSRVFSRIVRIDPSSHKKTIDRKRKFCGRSCSATSNNLSRREKRFCDYCKTAPLNKNSNSFCSRDCYFISNRITKKSEQDKWKEAGNTSDSASGSNGSLKNTYRQYLVSEASQACGVCGWNETHPVDGAPLVQIDHIDGDFKNNSYDNLRVLCPNCHSKTPTFGFRNKKGRGRVVRLRK